MHLLSVITCEDLGNNVENGCVEYSTPVEQAEGRYRLNTTATVTCDAGFTGGSDISCEENGEWTAPNLPTCKNGKSVKKLVDIYTDMQFALPSDLTTKMVLTSQIHM